VNTKGGRVTTRPSIPMTPTANARYGTLGPSGGASCASSRRQLTRPIAVIRSSIIFKGLMFRGGMLRRGPQAGVSPVRQKPHLLWISMQGGATSMTGKTGARHFEEESDQCRCDIVSRHYSYYRWPLSVMVAWRSIIAIRTLWLWVLEVRISPRPGYLSGKRSTSVYPK
jgi:hypothetical protein